MLKEQRRQAYLRAMGIEVYYPRHAVPGARPSPAYELPENQAEESATKTAPTAPADRSAGEDKTGADGQSNQTRAQLARQMLSASKTEGSRVSRHGNEAAPRSGPAEAEGHQESESLRFVLHYYGIDSRLAVLNEVPFQASRGDEGEVQALLRAILLALGVKTDTLKCEPFVWPLVDDPAADSAGPEQAKQALSGFIASCRERDQFANLLVFSAQINELLPGSDVATSHDFQLADSGLNLTCTHSIHSMLALPALKREAWGHLQALVKRLHKRLQ